jgi:hypothetical protein
VNRGSIDERVKPEAPLAGIPPKQRRGHHNCAQFNQSITSGKKMIISTEVLFSLLKFLLSTPPH